MRKYSMMMVVLFMMFGFNVYGFILEKPVRPPIIELTTCMQVTMDSDACYAKYKKAMQEYKIKKQNYDAFMTCMSQVKQIRELKQYIPAVRFYMIADHVFGCWQNYRSSIVSRKVRMPVLPLTMYGTCHMYREAYAKKKITFAHLKYGCSGYCDLMKRYYRFKHIKTPATWLKPTMRQVRFACREQRAPASQPTSCPTSSPTSSPTSRRFQ